MDTEVRNGTVIHEITTWSEFRSELLLRFANYRREERERWWFRGQGDSRWSLKTTLDRRAEFRSDDERRGFVFALLDEFKHEFMQVTTDAVLSLEGDALELVARHHGLPSPLLDWTNSPYIATFFAFQHANELQAENVAIWAFNRSICDVLDEDISLIDDIELLRFNPRALKQRSVFMRVSTIRQAIETLLAGSLIKFEIPWSEADVALADLDEMTLNSTYLFSDPEAAARTAALRLFKGRN